MCSLLSTLVTLGNSSATLGPLIVGVLPCFVKFGSVGSVGGPGWLL